MTAVYDQHDCLCSKCLCAARLAVPPGAFDARAYQSGYEIGVLKARVSRLEQEIDWLRQTVHRAHHDGPLDECKKNTCAAALRLLEAV